MSRPQGVLGKRIRLERGKALLLSGGKRAWKQTRRVGGFLREHWLKTIFSVVLFLGALSTIASFFGFEPFAESTPAGPPELLLETKTREPGGTQWLDLMSARPGGTGEYSIEVQNSGSGAANNLVVRMVLPQGLTIAAGSCRMVLEGRSSEPCSDNLVDGGLEFGRLSGQTTLTISFRAFVAVDAPRHNLRARALAEANGTRQVSDDVLITLPVGEAILSVRDLYADQLADSGFWSGEPELSARSKRLLIRRWDELRFDRPHVFGLPPRGVEVGIEDLYYERRYDGRIVQPSGYVKTVSAQRPIPDRPWLIRQSFEIEREGESPGVWCVAARRRGQPLGYGDFVWVKGVPIAWGSVVEQGARFQLATMLACSAVRRLSG